MKNRPKLEPAAVRIFTWMCRKPLPCLGRFHTTLTFKNRKIPAYVHVVEGPDFADCLLSLPTAERLKLVELLYMTEDAPDIVAKFPKLFKGLGKLTHFKVKLHINENITPVAQHHRKVPFHLQQAVDDELQDLLQSDIIERTSCKNGWPWGDLNKVLNAVCYPNEDGDPQATGTVLESEEYKQGNMSMSYRILNTKPKKNAGPPSISVSTVKGHLCVRKNGSVPLGHSDCHTTVSFEDKGKSSFLACRHTYFICRQKAYVRLPLKWGGTCYIAFLLPPVFVAPSTYHRDLLVPHVRHKRMIDISGIDHTETTLEQYTDFNKGFFFFIGPLQNSKLIRKLTRTLEAVVNQTVAALGNLTQEQSAIRLVALQDRRVLDVILADRGGACKIIGSSCCIYIPDNSPSVYTAITKLHKIAASLHQEPGTWTLSDWFWTIISSWGWKLLSAAGIIFLVITGCCLCIQCGPALCGLCATIFIPKPHIQQKEKEKIMLQECIDNLMQIEI
ncbi:uncharacterized protein LOC144764712 [Lissotriton helveticus]